MSIKSSLSLPFIICSLKAIPDSCDIASIFELDPISLNDSDALIPHKSFVLLKNVATNNYIKASNICVGSEIDKSVFYKVECSKARDEKEAFRVVSVNSDEVSVSNTFLTYF